MQDDNRRAETQTPNELRFESYRMKGLTEEQILKKEARRRQIYMVVSIVICIGLVALMVLGVIDLLKPLEKPPETSQTDTTVTTQPPLVYTPNTENPRTADMSSGKVYGGDEDGLKPEKFIFDDGTVEWVKEITLANNEPFLRIDFSLEPIEVIETTWLELPDGEKVFLDSDDDRILFTDMNGGASFVMTDAPAGTYKLCAEGDAVDAVWMYATIKKGL